MFIADFNPHTHEVSHLFSVLTEFIQSHGIGTIGTIDATVFAVLKILSVTHLVSGEILNDNLTSTQKITIINTQITKFHTIHHASCHAQLITSQIYTNIHQLQSLITVLFHTELTVKLKASLRPLHPFQTSASHAYSATRKIIDSERAATTTTGRKISQSIALMSILSLIHSRLSESPKNQNTIIAGINIAQSQI